MTLPPTRWPSAVATVARTYGVRGLALRTNHELRRALNTFRRKPRRDVGFAPAPRPHAFAVNGAALAAATDNAVAIERADRVAYGEYQAFRWHWRLRPATPGEWHITPIEYVIPSHTPWWQLPLMKMPGVDVKQVWEPARFAWAYDLVRAWVITHDDRYAAAFHDALAAWVEGNPPFRGVHWACGQETTIRAIALLYAEANLTGAPSSTQHAMARIAGVLAASGERIGDAIGYALSQRNNHGISEAVGLLVLGARFRGTHPEAVRWASHGKHLLEGLIRDQFAEDGWYIQHSFNYLRLALDQCIIAQRVLRSASISLSPVAVDRLRAATELLLAVMEPRTGVVPNHGANDGSFVHPITLAEFRDYRATVTAACASFAVPLPSNIPVDREVLAWLGLSDVPRGDAVRDGIHRGASGWAVARRGGTVAFLRAGKYTSRPGHLDSLHTDVRIRGREVIVDPGTYSYNAPPPWHNGLAGARVHNGPLLDEREPGVRGPRFLWYSWPEASLTDAVRDGDDFVLRGEVPGRLRRTVRVRLMGVDVEDEVLARDASRVVTRWLVYPGISADVVHVDGDRRVLAADEEDTDGWFSPTYDERIPSCCVEVERSAAPGVRVICEISMSPGSPSPVSNEAVAPAPR